MSLPQGTNPFPSGLTAQRQDGSSCCFQEKSGFSLAQVGWVLTELPPDALTQRAGQGEAGNEHGEKLSPSKQEQEVPHCVCSALTELGELQGGEVNIVRRGGASPGASLPTGRGPASSAPAGCWGPAGTWKKPGTEQGAGLGAGFANQAVDWGGGVSTAQPGLVHCYSSIPWVSSPVTVPAQLGTPAGCSGLKEARAESPLHSCTTLSCPEQVFTASPSPFPCP